MRARHGRQGAPRTGSSSPKNTSTLLKAFYGGYFKSIFQIATGPFSIGQAENLSKDLKTGEDKKELKRMKKRIYSKYRELFSPKRKLSSFFSRFRRASINFDSMKDSISGEKKRLQDLEKNAIENFTDIESYLKKDDRVDSKDDSLTRRLLAEFGEKGEEDNSGSFKMN